MRFLLVGWCSFLDKHGSRWRFFFILHFSIDFIRCQIEMKVFGSGGLNFHKSLAYFFGMRNDNDKPDRKTLRTWFTINVIDQTAHVASLYVIVKLVWFFLPFFQLKTAPNNIVTLRGSLENWIFWTRETPLSRAKAQRRKEVRKQRALVWSAARRKPISFCYLGMAIDKKVKYWITSANSDWRVARHLVEKKDYFTNNYLEKIKELRKWLLNQIQSSKR